MRKIMITEDVVVCSFTKINKKSVLGLAKRVQLYLITHTIRKFHHIVDEEGSVVIKKMLLQIMNKLIGF